MNSSFLVPTNVEEFTSSTNEKCGGVQKNSMSSTREHRRLTAQSYSGFFMPIEAEEWTIVPSILSNTKVSVSSSFVRLQKGDSHVNH
jgi:hypothetical protein